MTGVYLFFKLGRQLIVIHIQIFYPQIHIEICIRVCYNYYIESSKHKIHKEKEPFRWKNSELG